MRRDSESDIVRRYYDEVWNLGRMEVLEQTHATRVEIDLNGWRRMRSRAEIALDVSRWRAAHPGGGVEIHKILTAPGRVAVSLSFIGNLAATGAAVIQPALAIYSLQELRIVTLCEVVHEG